MTRTTQNTVLTWVGRPAAGALTATILVFCTLGSGEPASNTHARPTSRPVRKPGGKPSMLAFEAPTVEGGVFKFTGKPAPIVEPKVCLKCHDAKHSPRFDFKTARPNIVHNRAAELMKLPRAERAKRLKKLCSGADAIKKARHPFGKAVTPKVGVTP